MIKAGSLDSLNVQRDLAVGGARYRYFSLPAAGGDDRLLRAVLSLLEAAGATLVELPAPPTNGSSPGGNRGIEGWARYIEQQNGAFPFATGNELLADPRVLPYNARNNNNTPRMTPEQVDAWLAYRASYKEVIGQWMTGPMGVAQAW